MFNGFTDEMIDSGHHLAEENPGDLAAALINFFASGSPGPPFPVSRRETGTPGCGVTQREAIFS